PKASTISTRCAPSSAPSPTATRPLRPRRSTFTSTSPAFNVSRCPSRAAPPKSPASNSTTPACCCTKVLGWRTSDIHQAILACFAPSAERYTLTQLRYDLRKLKAHGLLERDGRRYAYRLTDKGTRAALLFVLFHRRVCGPLANSLFHHRPTRT